MRLLAGMLSSQPFSSVLIGDDSLSKRPMSRITEPLSSMGAKIEEQDITSSIYLLDTPKINPIESGLSLLKGYVLLGVLIYMITFILLIYRDREKIII